MDARYRLASMREVRSREQRVRRVDLAGQIGDARALAVEVDRATQRVAQLRAALAAAVEDRAGALARGTPIAAMVQRERYVQKLRRDLDAAQGELARAEAKHLGQLGLVDAARARLAHARAERELIERHFATWRAARQKLAERRED
ncbi:MAG TPA: hypothetical protein VH165_31210 [Kofleriaceae bacterium]|nr:hypothetical protein [Kofleriaceae bacterium]